MPGHLDEAARVDGRAGPVADRRVRAEHAFGREIPAACGEHDADGDQDEGGGGSETQEWAETRAIPRGKRVERDRQDERREQHERLEPNCCGRGRPAREHAVAPRRRRLHRACEGEERGRDDRQRQRLRHEESRVVQRGRDERQRRGDDGPARRDEPSSPEVRRDRDERGRERLQEASPLDPVRQVERGERRSDERRGQQAVVRRREPADAQCPLRPERLADEPVDHLVRRDPGRREGLCRCEADDRGEHHEARHEERGARHAPRGRAV